MNRTELQQLSSDRIEDARILLAAARWSGAYYLAGYALECALKSCVLAYIERTGIIFEDKKYAERCWTHDIEELVKHAGLLIERQMAAGVDPNFQNCWLIVSNWSELSRYRTYSQADAEQLYEALTDNATGVLPWVQKRW